MSRVRDMLFELVNYKLFGKAADVDRVRDFLLSEGINKLYALAKMHDLSHLVGAAFESLGLLSEDDLSKKMRKQYFAAIYRYRGIEHELRNIKALLSEHKIQHIPLKGSVIRALYPEPWMRTSCDIDILVRKEDVERARELLEGELAYKMTSECFHDIAFFSPGGVHVELHFTLIEDFRYPKINEILSCVWERAEAGEGDFTYAMPRELFYFYHVSHMMKHLFEAGCGIRFFIDLLLIDEGLELNREELDSMLSAAGLLDYRDRSLELARIWFREGEHTEFSRIYEKHILRGGIYGTKESKVIVNQKRKGGKFGYAMRRIFLPYRSLCEMFPVIKKHKWLTPVFEVVRWFRLIFRGKLRSSVDELRANANVSTDDANQAAEMLDVLGLGTESIISKKEQL